MKRTTLVFDDLIYEKVKSAAVKNKMPIREMVSMLLRKGLAEFLGKKKLENAFQFKSYHLGKEMVNIANRDELFRAMEGANEKA